MEESEQLPPRIQYWLTEAKHDCFFVVGPEDGPTERIGALKSFFVGFSEPLTAMMQDTELAGKEDIRVKDVKPETFRNFLKCVYGASSLVIKNLTFEECAHLLYVSEKYLVSDFKDDIIDKLKSVFSFDDIFFALSQPVLYQNEDWEVFLFEYTRYYFDKIITHERFFELNETGVIRMLELPRVTTSFKETDIWKIILQWAKHKTDSTDGKVIRAYIFKILKYIRFLAMDCTAFFTEVVPSDVLLKEEVYEICKSICTGNPHNIGNLCAEALNRFDYKDDDIISSFIGRPKYAVINWVISKLNVSPPEYDKVCSWAEHRWILKLEKRNRINPNTDYAILDVYAYRRSPEMTISAHVTVCVLNQNGESTVTVTQVVELKESANYERFWIHPWNALLDPKNGFVKDDTLTLTVTMNLLNS